MWGRGFDQKGAGLEGGGREGEWTGGQFVRGSYKSFKGINLTVLGKNYLWQIGKWA